MKIEIRPSVLSGEVTAPASKSLSHRLLICAGFCKGESTIHNIEYSDDILATLDCLEAFGAEVIKGDGFVKIRGVDPCLSKGGIFPCRESGSTLRFLLPFAMLSEGKSLFTCKGSLVNRPMEIYKTIAEEKGIVYEKSNEGITVSGVLCSGAYKVRGDISSQFVTGFLLALPFCKGDSRIVISGKAESMSYIDMTVSVQRLFGADIKKEDNNVYYIKGSQEYKAVNCKVEGDFSNAAFLEAFNHSGSQLTVKGLCTDTLQGDKVFYSYFEQLKKTAPVLDVSDCPDLAPVIMALACRYNGARLVGTNRLKFKESDRGVAMKAELSKFGADISVLENEIIISKTELHPPCAELCGHNDHRVVMSLAVLCSAYGGVINGCEAVSKSYPDFFENLRNLGMDYVVCD